MEICNKCGLPKRKLKKSEKLRLKRLFSWLRKQDFAWYNKKYPNMHTLSKTGYLLEIDKKELNTIGCECND